MAFKKLIKFFSTWHSVRLVQARSSLVNCIGSSVGMIPSITDSWDVIRLVLEFSRDIKVKELLF